MRKIILALAVSLDGYIARENGAVDWLKMQDLTEAADESKEFFASVDAIFLGRKTYEKALELGGGFGETKCYVFSRSLKTATSGNTEIVSENVGEFVEKLKRENGKNILLMGGGDIARTFFENRLIDQMIFGVQPVILGRGIPLFLPHERSSELELSDVKIRKSGTVQLSYRVKN